MPKLLWVTLPLLALLAWWVLGWLRRRPPSRQAINIVSSLLLLGYVSTTASLGIFWVAQQQLPVFDWHYLFGYATATLVVLHLVFNAGVVWRYFMPRPRIDAVPAARALPARRRALGVVAAAFAALAAFALGLRHGRSELRLQWPAAGAAAGGQGAEAMTAVERLHAFSSLSRGGVLLRAPSVDWGDPPPPFKSYPGAATFALPAVEAATRPLADNADELRALAAVLWSAAGITERRQGLALRAAPSSGALFSSELYVVARSLGGLPPGHWHYDPERHALRRVGDLPGDTSALDGLPMVPQAAALLVASAIFRRSGHKYRDRTYRYVTADLGHALENVLQASRALGFVSTLLPAFDEARMAALLGLDEREEGVLAVVALHVGTVPSSAASEIAPRWRTPPLPDEASFALGVTAATHLATSLRGPAAARSAATPLPPGAIVLARAPQAAADPLAVIARRRSVRRYAATPLAIDALSALLDVMRHPPQLSSAVRIDVVVHAVAGVAPGSWRYDAAVHALLPRRVGTPLRDAARAAALDQDVIGDAAAVFVLSLDRAAIAADPAGAARGWRHGFIEAGLVGERVYLEAAARGLGACAVGAFYDDEAVALVAGDAAAEWIVHFAALGVPA